MSQNKNEKADNLVSRMRIPWQRQLRKHPPVFISHSHYSLGTYLRLSITPGGTEPTSSLSVHQRDSMSAREMKPVFLSSITSKRVRIAVTNFTGRPEHGYHSYHLWCEQKLNRIKKKLHYILPPLAKILCTPHLVIDDEFVWCLPCKALLVMASSICLTSLPDILNSMSRYNNIYLA